MNRIEFRKLFNSIGPVVLPVIHVLDNRQVERNVQILLGEGAPGCFLINHDFGIDQFLPIIEATRRRFPSLWMGVNFLATTGGHAAPLLRRLRNRGVLVDGYWADDARIDERLTQENQYEARDIAEAIQQSGWDGLYIGGVCFKKQREVNPDFFETSARLASFFMDAVCTSGPATGRPAEVSKVLAFRKGAGEKALLLASGTTPDNAVDYIRYVDGFMVATGINYQDDFYNIEPARLRRLLATCSQNGTEQCNQ